MMDRKPTYRQLEFKIRTIQRHIDSVSEDLLTANGPPFVPRSAKDELTAPIEKEQLILEKNLKIDIQAKELKKIDAAFEVLMDQHHRKKKVVKDMIYRNYTKLILPDLYELKKKLRRKSTREMVSLIIDNIDHLLSPDSDKLNSEIYKLTKTELKVATMIRSGMTSRQIREHLSISLDTVAFHRKNLRKKLGISQSDKELCQFLQHHL